MRIASSRFMNTRSVLWAPALALAIAATGCDSTGSTSEFGGSGGSGETTGASGALGLGGNLGTGGTFSGDAALQGDAMDLGDACGQTTIKGASKEVDILLVIDKSGSMNATPAGFASDKWTALKTALPAALDPVKGGISFGVELFPTTSSHPFLSRARASVGTCRRGERHRRARGTGHHDVADHLHQVGRRSGRRHPDQRRAEGGFRLLHDRNRQGARRRQVRASRY